jgi:hypothetical protein
MVATNDVPNIRTDWYARTVTDSANGLPALCRRATEEADTSFLASGTWGTRLVCWSSLEICDDRIRPLWPTARRICPLLAPLVRVTLQARFEIRNRGALSPCVAEQGQSLSLQFVAAGNHRQHHVMHHDESPRARESR